jgi:hypothetical protein
MYASLGAFPHTALLPHPQFVEPPVLDLAETLGDSTPLSPLIFVLSAGVDPTDMLRKLAAVGAGIMPLTSCSPFATSSHVTCISITAPCS